MEYLFAFFAGIAFFSRAKQSLPPREGRRVLRALASNAPVGWKVHSYSILTSFVLCSFLVCFDGKIFILFYYYLILSILFLYQLLIPWSPSFNTIHSKFSYHFSKFSYRKTEMKCRFLKKSFFSKVVSIQMKCRNVRREIKI